MDRTACCSEFERVLARFRKLTDPSLRERERLTSRPHIWRHFRVYKARDDKGLNPASHEEAISIIKSFSACLCDSILRKRTDKLILFYFKLKKMWRPFQTEWNTIINNIKIGENKIEKSGRGYESICGWTAYDRRLTVYLFISQAPPLWTPKQMERSALLPSPTSSAQMSSHVPSPSFCAWSSNQVSWLNIYWPRAHSCWLEQRWSSLIAHLLGWKCWGWGWVGNRLKT